MKKLEREVNRKLSQSYWKYMSKLFREPLQEEAEEGAEPCLKRNWTYIKQ